MEPDNFKTLKDVQKIAVLRCRGISGFIFAAPALEALKHAYPEAEIIYLANPGLANFLEGRPGPVDRVEVVPAFPGINGRHDIKADEAQLKLFSGRMQKEKLDLALQLHGGGIISNPFIKSFRAKLAAGMMEPGAETLDRWIPYNRLLPEIFMLLEAASIVGAYPVTLRPEIVIKPGDIKESEEIMTYPGKPIAVVHAGASDPKRRWPYMNYSRLCDELIGKGLQVILVGDIDERETIYAVVENMQEKPVNAAGKLSLNGLAGLISRADLFVGNDSGPCHIAEAVGTPAAGIFWLPFFLNTDPVTRDTNYPLVCWKMECPVCGEVNDRDRDCGHQESFVSEIKVEEVLKACWELF